MEEQKKKRFYPENRIKIDDAFCKAIVVLRDCGGLSFGAITKLLKKPDAWKRNTIYYYERDKNKYTCSRSAVHSTSVVKKDDVPII